MSALAKIQEQRYRAVPRWVNSLADAVVKLGHGRGGPNVFVETDTDWQVIAGIVDLYATVFPGEWKAFLRSNKLIKSHQADKFGLLKDKSTRKGGEVQLRQLGQWPFELETLIRVICPDQRFDRKFIRGFMGRLPVFKTAEKI